VRGDVKEFSNHASCMSRACLESWGWGVGGIVLLVILHRPESGGGETNKNL